MNKIFLSGWLGAAALTGVVAQADPIRPNPPGPGRGNCRVDQNVRVGRWLRNGEELRLRQLFDLDRDCNGLRLEVVSAFASSNDRYSRLVLEVNNRTVGRAQDVSSRDARRYDFYLPNNQDRLGTEINSLQLRAQGQVYIDRVQVRIDERGGPRPGPGPGPRPPGPGPGPGPGPRPPQPNPQQYVWQTSAGGGYYDATGRIQGSQRLPNMRYYGGILASGEPVPMYQVLVNAVGHICNQPGYSSGSFAYCQPGTSHYE